jgi:hypothetical protein
MKRLDGTAVKEKVMNQIENRATLDGEKDKTGLVVERRVDGRLWAVKDGEAVPVTPARCFPWSAPMRCLSLRDDEEREVALVWDPAELDPESRSALEEALVLAAFVLDVISVEEVEEDVEIRRWKVLTRQGERSFQTALDTWPREGPSGGLLLEDVAGDLYRIPPPEELDARSRKRVWAFLD